MRVLVLVAFGGLGTLLGPVIGAGVFAILDERLTASLELREVLYGVFVIVIFLPSGAVSSSDRLARRPLLRPGPTAAARRASVTRVALPPDDAVSACNSDLGGRDERESRHELHAFR